jgi:hypothetical protein
MPVVGAAPCPWADTMAGKLGFLSLLHAGDKVQRCRSIVLPNADVAEISRFVIYRRDRKTCVGRVEDILVELETDTVLGILVLPCIIGPDILPYRLPSCTVQLDGHQMVAFKVSNSLLHVEFRLNIDSGTCLCGQCEPQLCSSSMSDDTHTSSITRTPADR